MPSGQEQVVTQRAPRSDALRNDRLVIEAARAVFAENGLQASMEDIAARAGVGVGTIYRRFASKEHLLDALAQQLAQEVDDAAAAAVADEDPERGLTTFLEFIGDFNAQKLRYSAAILERADDYEPGPTTAKIEALTRNAIAAGVLAPDIRAEDIKALIVALRGVVATSPGAGDAEWRRFLRMHVAGMRPRNPRD